MTTARFHGPTAIAKFGTNWLISDGANYCIRRIDSSGNVSTIVGLCGTKGNVPSAGTTVSGSAARLGSPKELVVVGTDLYITDSDYHKIRKVDLSDLNNIQVSTFAGSSAGSIDAVGTAARFNRPWGLASDGTFLYVSDYTGHTIRRVSLSSAEVTTVAGLNVTSGTTDGIGTAARFKSPLNIAVGAGYLYISDYGNSLIRKMDLNNFNVTTLVGGAGSAVTLVGALGPYSQLSAPRGLMVSGEDLYLTDTGTRLISKINTTTGATTVIAGKSGMYGSLDGTAEDETPVFRYTAEVDGVVYATDKDQHLIWKIDASGHRTVFAGRKKLPGTSDGSLLSAQFNTPLGITALGKSLYIADRSSSTIRRIDLLSSTVSTVAGSALQIGSDDGVGTAARFLLPQGITNDGTHLYVSDSGNMLIRRVRLSDLEVTTIAGVAGLSGTQDGPGLEASFAGPLGLVWLAGSVYVADVSSHTIRKIDLLDNNKVTTLVGTAGTAGATDGSGVDALLSGPSDLGTDGKYLYFADSANGVIRRTDPSTGETKTWLGVLGARVDKPSSVSEARLYRPMSLSITPNAIYINSDHRALMKLH